MKSHHSFFCCVLLLCLGAVAPSYAGQPAVIKLSAWSIQPRAGAVNGVGLWIRLTDTARYPLRLSEHQNRDIGEASYILNVRDAAGNTPALTEYGRRIYGGSELFVPGTYVGVTLQPGQSIVDAIRADKIYDMTATGTYTIWVTRQVGDDAARYAQSNPVTVTVAP